MAFAIKAEVGNPRLARFDFAAQKTTYGGKHIGKGDRIFIFASENEGGSGLIASGVVTSAEPLPKKRGIVRQNPRVSVTIRRTALAKRSLGRSELKHFSDWEDGRPETELNSNCIVRQRIRLSASPMRPPRFSANSSRRSENFGVRIHLETIVVPFRRFQTVFRDFQVAVPHGRSRCASRCAASRFRFATGQRRCEFP